MYEQSGMEWGLSEVKPQLRIHPYAHFYSRGGGGDAREHVEGSLLIK